MSALDRFIKAQENDYATALEEIQNGRKESCWMWYIFPQIQGLGQTQMSKIYAIRDIEEAIEYLNHDILRSRLIEITQALLDLGKVNINGVLGSLDALKLKSCMTLFREAEKSANVKCDDIFQKVLDQFYKGEEDEKTLTILQKQKFEKDLGIKGEENEGIYSNKTILEKETEYKISEEDNNDKDNDKDNDINKINDKENIDINYIPETETQVIEEIQEVQEKNNIENNNEIITPESNRNKGQMKEKSNILSNVSESNPMMEIDNKNYKDKEDELDEDDDDKEVHERRRCCPNCIII